MNYYEILQVDKKASEEVIDKAFKVLAKKYHPDTQQEDKKEWAEQKFKELNNAYEVLSDMEKRSQYDATLEEELSEMELALIQKNRQLSNLVDDLQNKLIQYEKQNTINPFFYTAYHPPVEHVYQPPQTNSPTKEEPYIETFRRDKLHSLKNFISFLMTILIVAIVFIILWLVPFTRSMFINLYENNDIIKGIINLLFQIK